MERELKIPTSFKLLGQTILVVEDATLAQRDGFRGVARYSENTIGIMPSSESFTMLPSQKEQTFFHELVHFCLEAMGERELVGNEKFVDMLASLLHQAFKTMEFKEANHG